MKADVIHVLCELHRKSLELKQLPGQPGMDRFLVPGYTDQPLEILHDPAPRGHTVGSLADLVASALEFAPDRGQIEGAPAEAVCWYQRDQVIVILDDNGGRFARLTLPLLESDVFRTVCRLGDFMEQKAFVRLLKIDLGRCLAPADLLDIVRKVKFENGQTIRAEIGRQKESMGKSVTAEVSAERDIPEVVTLQVRLWKNPDLDTVYPIQCSVEVDPVRGDPFRLKPLPDELDRVLNLALADLAVSLCQGLGKDIPVYFGVP